MSSAPLSRALITSEEVRLQALAIGWDDVAITDPVIPAADIADYHSWLERGDHGTLSYMENDIRTAPERLLPGAKSVILCVTNYKQEKLPLRSDAGLVAAYARGRDYHRLHRQRLKALIRWLEHRSGSVGIAVGFSDSKPILEKALFVRAGLGWFGKNSLLIHRRFGTYTLLAGLLTTLELPIPPPLNTRVARCGPCRRCLDACPTNALVTPYQVNATRCLSYHLIESKEPIPPHITVKNPGYLFGCDICQEVCPHNVRSPLTTTADFSSERGVGPYLTAADLEELRHHPDRLHGTPLQRRGVDGLIHTFSSLNLKREI